MTTICFVCNLPILSHQVGLIWQGGNGWDDLMREQLEESTLKARLGGRRDSAAQITSVSPPTETQETSPPTRRRRRSSLAQLTDIIKDWSGSAGRKRKEQLSRRETLADLAKSLPWSRSDTTRKRRESSVDSGVKSSSSKSGHDSGYSIARTDIYRLLNNASRRQSNTMYSSDVRRSSGETRRDSSAALVSRRGSGESAKTNRRDSLTTSSPKHHRHHAHHPQRGRRGSKPDFQTYRDERKTSLTAETTIGTQFSFMSAALRIDSSTQALPPPTIITSSVTPPSTSPSISPPRHTPPISDVVRDSPPSRPMSPQPVISAGTGSSVTTNTTVTSITVLTSSTTESSIPSSVSSSTHPLVTSKRDSTTQVRYSF